MDLSILIVNWKSRDYVRHCVRSLYTHTSGLAFEVIVIDSGSNDGCGNMLAREFPQVRFIQARENLGFARANNVAAQQARGDLLLLLNPDTEVRDNALKTMVEAFRATPKAGALGVRLLNSDGTLQTTSVHPRPRIGRLFLDANLLRRLVPRSRLWGGRVLYDRPPKPAAVECLSGACILTPRALYDQVGGLTEAYFMYYEDIDYCVKVAQAGWRVVHLSTVEIIHHGGRSSGGGASTFSSVMIAKAGAQYFHRHYGPVRARAYRGALGLKAALRLLALGVFYVPAALLARSQQVRFALRRWLSVLRWSLGRERWADTFPRTGSGMLSAG
jgi:N-acetylglucosaminyl-diphospho-decaprenol L-rhamnosyltransferase